MEFKRTTVVNVNDDCCDVYIGRSNNPEIGYFGNPFHIGKDGTRKEVLAKYKEYFIDRVRKDQEFYKRVMALQGKRIGCFCKPEACHGDIIATYIDFP